MDKSFTVIEENAKDAPVKDVLWEGHQIESAPSDPMIDKGTGEKTVVRSYFFAVPEGSTERDDFHWEEFTRINKHHVQANLLKDGMNLIEGTLWASEVNPKLIKLSCFCLPRPGAVILERPQLINES